jgi:mesencephalic astrocyte-derived neurotrophic factor
VPPKSICGRLKSKDSALCSLRYTGSSVEDVPKKKPSKPIDFANLNKMRVKELKKILSNWGEGCRGCSEKRDYIDRINAVKDAHKSEL